MFRVGVFAVDPETEKWASLHDMKQKHLPEASRPKYGLEYPQARHTNPCQVERAVFTSFPATLLCSTIHRRVHHVSRASRKSPFLTGLGGPGAGQLYQTCAGVPATVIRHIIWVPGPPRRVTLMFSGWPKNHVSKSIFGADASKSPGLAVPLECRFG